MGLDTSHDCWHGAYSAFLRWRHTLAEVAGYKVIKGYIVDEGTAHAEYVHDHVDLQWDRFEEKNYMGEWDEPPEDPLIVLLAHSDCDGTIPHFWTEPLAVRLERLLPKLEGLEGGGHIGNYQEKTQRFIDGLRRAHEVGEDVDFH